jgi:YcxB-like protein
LNETVNREGARYVFQINEDEATTFRRYLVRNQKRYADRYFSRGIPLIAFAIVLIPVWIAYNRGLLPISAVLFAELGLGVGCLSVLIGIIAGSRRAFRKAFRESRSAQVSFDCSFDNTGIVVKKGALETRLTWDAIARVQDEGPIIAFWYDPTQGFLIPARVFSDAAARNAFAAWAKDRVAASPHAMATPT